MNLGPTNKNRGAQINPQNRFESRSLESDFADWEYLDENPLAEKDTKTQVLIDHSKSILTKNNSPDICFTYSVNPYRGCEHGCSYCYARPTHEYLGMNAGLDFESKILVKIQAPKLLDTELRRRSWNPEPIAFSGVTDCYQPLERKYQLTRQCLEVLLKFRQPAFIISKNILMLRDLELLKKLVEKNLIHITLSVTTLDPKLANVMEPRTPPPAARLKAIRIMRENGIPVSVNIAPIIPGLTDKEIPDILQACAKAGAMSAGHTLLRLPLNVQPIFVNWLESHYPEKADRVKALQMQMRGGKMNDANFGSRMRGKGSYAENIADIFKIFSAKYKLNKWDTELDSSHFRIPDDSGQTLLFPEEE